MMIRKLIVFLIMFLCITSSVLAVAYVNVGPTTEFTGNVGTTGNYYISDVQIAYTNVTGALGVTMANVGTTAINASLIADSADDTDLGSATYEWRNIYVGTAGKIYMGTSQEIALEVTDANTLAITASAAVVLSGGLTVTGALLPAAASTHSIGSATFEWADLYLDDTGYVYFGIGQDVHIQRTGANTMTITASGGVTFSAGVSVSGTLALGANNITMSGSIGVTGTRVTKGWFTDLEISNVPTVGGVAMTAIYAPLGNYFLHLMDVDAADVDYVHAAIVGTGASQDINTGITNPDYGRNITVTSTAGSVGVVTITGTTVDGTTSATDAITIVDGGTASGVKAFVYVSNINVSSALISPEEVTIGIGDIIGLPNPISEEADIYMKTVDGAEEYGEISGNANITYNTLDCSTIVQNEDITILYHP